MKKTLIALALISTLAACGTVSFPMHERATNINWTCYETNLETDVVCYHNGDVEQYFRQDKPGGIYYRLGGAS